MGSRGINTSEFTWIKDGRLTSESLQQDKADGTRGVVGAAATPCG